MESWIQQVLTPGNSGLAVLPAAFLLGVLGAVSSCCTAPMVAAVAGYGGSIAERPTRKEILFLSLFFMVGTIFSLAALGAAASFAGHTISAALGRYWHFAGGLVIVLFGLLTMGIVPFRMGAPRFAAPTVKRGMTGAMVYGLAVGGATSACAVGCNPLLPVAVGAAILKGASLLGAAMLALFALGYSLPLTAALIGVGFGAEKLAKPAQRFMPAVRGFFGLVLIAAGFYLLAKP